MCRTLARDSRWRGSVAGMVDRIPSANAIGLTLAHHGLVVFGDGVRECYTRTLKLIGKIEEYLATCRRGRVRASARPQLPPPEARQRLAEQLLPVVRGALGQTDRVILNFDDGEELLETLSEERMPELVRRGMATPEHLLRAGRLPIWLELDPATPSDQVAGLVRIRSLRSGPNIRGIMSATPHRGSVPWKTGPRWCWCRGSE